LILFPLMLWILFTQNPTKLTNTKTNNIKSQK
jgi:hypothetical protein